MYNRGLGYRDDVHWDGERTSVSGILILRFVILAFLKYGKIPSQFQVELILATAAHRP